MSTFIVEEHLMIDWLPPCKLVRLVERKQQLLGDDTFLNSRRSKMLREAWVVGMVGRLVGVPLVKMVEDHQPDALCKLSNGCEVPVEVTELLQEGRRRGDEELACVRRQYHGKLQSAVNLNEVWIKRLLHKKFKKDKNYPNGTVIFMYHNTSLYCWPSRREKIECEIEVAARRKSSNISGSVILFHDKVYGQDSIKQLSA